jgi:hypothetical protein
MFCAELAAQGTALGSQFGTKHILATLGSPVLDQKVCREKKERPLRSPYFSDYYNK